jgi:DNA-binding transcriptional LysR family regulator
VNIHTLDLNLFLAFHAIYSTGSVTRAGERLGMTQSAVSNALKRLRERFGDPLFVRTTEGMVPTPLAERLIGPVEAGLSQFGQAMEQSQPFEADTSDRTFRLALNEVGHQVMLPSLLRHVRERAPRVRLETTDATQGDMRQRMQQGQIELAIGSWESMGPTFYQRRLFDEVFMVLCRRGHPFHAKGGGIERYLEAEHAVYRPHGATDLELQQALRAAGIHDQRTVVLTTDHSHGLAEMALQAGLLVTLPARLARSIARDQASLVSLPLPLTTAPFSISQQWHERMHQDLGHRWLREMVFSLFRAVSGAAPEEPVAS